VKRLTSLFVALLCLAIPAFAGITVTSPASTVVTSPFTLTASAPQCSGHTTVSMGYSLDHNTNALVVYTQTINASVTASLGLHTLHVKCWAKSGVADAITLDINVTQPLVAAPHIFPVSGTYTAAQTVYFTEATQGATIYYTLDGTVPTTASPVYTGSFTVSRSTVIRANAVKVGYRDSGTASANIVISLPAPGPVIPDTAQKTTEIQQLPNWRIKHDPVTGGSATGTMTIVGSPTLSGGTAQFVTTYSNWGGILYSVTYGKDTAPKNFVYDAQVYIAPGSELSNLEMDNNQVLANGHTVIFGFQCSGNAGFWEYTENSGTGSHWLKSDQPCNPMHWDTGVWHHVQVSYSRDDFGNVTYHSVWVDGVEQPINKTVNSDFALGWATVLIANFQVDGLSGTGSSTLFLDDFTIYRW
jgi:hypothetical protein